MDTLLPIINPGLVILGFILISLELFIGLDSLFDLVLSGLALIAGGMLGLLLGNNVVVGLVLSLVFLIGYWFLGRAYLKDKLQPEHTHSNVDRLPGMVVQISKQTARGTFIANVEGEDWSVSCEQQLQIGDKVEILSASGAILIVKKTT